MEFFRNASKGKNNWYLYLIGIVIVIFGYGIIGQTPLLLATLHAVNEYSLGMDVLKKFEETTDFSLLHISNNLGFFLMVLIFFGAMLGLYFALRVHGKKWYDITTTRSIFDFRRYLFGFGWWMALTILMEVVAFLIYPDNYSFSFDAGNFVILLAISLFLLPVQTAFEELFFRGYIQQGLFQWTRLPIIAILVSSLFFSLVHSANPEIDKFGFFPMQLYYIGAGIFLALVAFFDEGLEMSIGIYTATNFYGAVFIKYEGSVIQTDALFSMKTISVYFMVAAFYISAVAFFYIAAKKYQWKPDFSKLWKVDTLQQHSSEL